MFAAASQWKNRGIKEQIEYFAGRGKLDIEGLGPAIIDQLVDQSTEPIKDKYQKARQKKRIETG